MENKGKITLTISFRPKWSFSIALQHLSVPGFDDLCCSLISSILYSHPSVPEASG